MVFCEKCGSMLANNKCDNCGFQKFENPIPVAVALIPVIKGSKTFLLGVKRGIEPKKGCSALPGGFQEIEDIKTTLIREVKEECGIDVSIDEHAPVFAESSFPVPNRLLIFITTKPVSYPDINWDFKNEETEQLILINENDSLAFSLHEKACEHFFSSNINY